ncbi:MAG: hypothetical protein AB1898_20630 [Acidobacteriota bacterium]
MNCQSSRCNAQLNWFRSKIRKQLGYYFESHWYCSDGCLEEALLRQIEQWSACRHEIRRDMMHIKLGHILMDSGVLTKAGLDQALLEQRRALAERQKQGEDGKPDEKLGYFLQELKLVKEHHITAALSRQFRLPVINLTRQKIDESVVRMVPGELVRGSKFFPLDFDANERRLALVTYDPSDISLLVGLRDVLDCDIAIYLCDESIVREMIHEFCRMSDLRNAWIHGGMNGEIPGNAKSLSSLIVDQVKKLNARSLTLHRVQYWIWARLMLTSDHLDLVFQMPEGWAKSARA